MKLGENVDSNKDDLVIVEQYHEKHYILLAIGEVTLLNTDCFEC